MTEIRKYILGLLTATVALGPTNGPAAGKIDFNRDIRPILSNNCYACHGPDEDERKAKLRLDTQGGAMKDLGGYAAVTPGKPDVSELIKRVITADEDDLMPPAGKGKRLSGREVQLLKDWIAQGADFAVHWSYAAVERAEIPASKSKWLRNVVDNFVLRKLGERGLQPSAEADRWTLARRAAVDLIGLPPTVAELKGFVNDPEPKAFERYVDRLLAKDAFGEHWSRMWLDLARYADSAGYPSDPGRTIWTYRDWVIRAFNDNMPFDQFTVEQIAGDLLPKPTDSQLIATAFHRNTMTQNEGGTSDEEFRNAAIIDRVNTTMEVWMGTSMACAQCHTHKYDPITQHEYFSLFAVLNNTADADKKDESPLHSFYLPDQRKEQKKLQTEVARLQKKFGPKTEEWLGHLSYLQKEFTAGMKWDSPKPISARAQKGTKLEIRPDRSIVSSGPKDKDTFIVEVPLTGKKLTGIRLEALTDQSLPNKKGPGWARGNFVVSRVTAQIVRPASAPHKGRFIRVELPGSKPFLHLAEVQVFGGGMNLALKGKATQSGDYADAVASRAIDGNTDGDYKKGSVAHSAGKGPIDWWEVDLQTDQLIERIVLWNRTDGSTAIRLKNYTVKLLDANRTVVWAQTEKDSFPKDKAFAIGGPTTIEFRGAVADYSQGGFDPGSVTSTGSSKERGWAVGGQLGRFHDLTLLPKGDLKIPTGAKLRVILRHNDATKQALLGRFRVQVSADPKADQWRLQPQFVLNASGKKISHLSPDIVTKVVERYIQTQSPNDKTERNSWIVSRKKLAAIKPMTVPVMLELAGEKRRKTRVQIRGNWQSLGDEVTADIPSAFHPLPEGAPKNRLSLAQWLIARDNPLTARVAVNRFWENLFGTGLVRTSEEFGAQGELPSHPALLDWLSAEFMDSGWDVKKLLRQIATSAAYRQSSKVTRDMLEADPANRLFTRGPRFRATGEMLRDQALFVGGLLQPKLFGPPVRPVRPKLGVNTAFGKSNDWEASKGEDRHRRSVYTETRRNSPYPSFAIFGAPNREVCTIRRSRSNTPLQAFVTMNDPAHVEAAQALGRRAVEEGGTTDASRLEFLFLTCVSRKPSSIESQRLLRLLATVRKSYEADKAFAMKMATEPLGPHAGPDYSEPASWSAIANVILNLDEMIMRR